VSEASNFGQLNYPFLLQSHIILVSHLSQRARDYYGFNSVSEASKL
jgi:hypothetical protein